MAEHVATGFIELSGHDLTGGHVLEAAAGEAKVRLSPEARADVAAAHTLSQDASARGDMLYGQNTGVGANKITAVDAGQAYEHGYKLLRSHAAGSGPEVNALTSRAAMAIRLNQLAAGGSGVNPLLTDHLCEAVNLGLSPPLRRYGAIGTGDLAALATMGLCLVGERPWRGGDMPPYLLDKTDALALMSSSALTLAETVVATETLHTRLATGTKVAALSLAALGGSPELYDEAVSRAKQSPGQATVAHELSALLGQAYQPHTRNVQNGFNLRILPQVNGATKQALKTVDHIVEREMNSANENPLFDIENERVLHNGNFDTTELGLALDSLKAAVFITAGLASARLSALMEPANTGLEPFLADNEPGSSGTLMIEYDAQASVAQLRSLASPDSLAQVYPMSRGNEDHASFSTQAVHHLQEMLPPYEQVLAAELCASVRALKQQGSAQQMSDGPMLDLFKTAENILGESMNDHPLEAELDAVLELIRNA